MADVASDVNLQVRTWGWPGVGALRYHLLAFKALAHPLVHIVIAGFSSATSSIVNTGRRGSFFQKKEGKFVGPGVLVHC